MADELDETDGLGNAMTEDRSSMGMPRKLSLAELERERRAIKVRLSANHRWVHRKTGRHYIVLDIIRFVGDDRGDDRFWQVVFAPAGEVNPVPFGRRLEVFERKFRPFS